MFMNMPHRYILCSFAILSLSACSTPSFKEHSIFSTDAGKSQREMETSNNNVPVPVPVTNRNITSPDGSVEIFDMELNPEYRRGVLPPMQQSQVQSVPMSPVLTYGEELRTSDSSVTIYGLDNVPSVRSVQPDRNNVNYEQMYTQNYKQNFDQSYSNVAGQIFFKHGSSRLGSGDMKKISGLADQAKFAPVNHITIEGFASKPTQAGTDTTQAHIINLRQSLKRAEKVSDALMREGVPGDKLKTVSWGSAKATGNESQDRRVDVVMGER